MNGHCVSWLKECVWVCVCVLGVCEDKQSFQCWSHAFLVCSPASNFMWQKSFSQCPQCIFIHNVGWNVSNQLVVPVKLDLKIVTLDEARRWSVKMIFLIWMPYCYMLNKDSPDGGFFYKNVGPEGKNRGKESWEGNLICKATLMHLFTFSFSRLYCLLLCGTVFFKLCMKFYFESGKENYIMSLNAQYSKWNL